jgi:hypothetical protein
MRARCTCLCGRLRSPPAGIGERRRPVAIDRKGDVALPFGLVDRGVGSGIDHDPRPHCPDDPRRLGRPREFEPVAADKLGAAGQAARLSSCAIWPVRPITRMRCPYPNLEILLWIFRDIFRPPLRRLNTVAGLTASSVEAARLNAVMAARSQRDHIKTARKCG